MVRLDTWMLTLILRGSGKAKLLRAAVLIALIAFTDWRLGDEIPLGVLYLFPMLLVGSVLTRLQIGMVAVLCTFLAELFDGLNWFHSPGSGITRDGFMFIAFFFVGVFMFEVNRTRTRTLSHMDEMQTEAQRRREAEEQLEVLVRSSPIAIVIVDADKRVLLANDTADRLLGIETGSLSGRCIGDYLPSLATIGDLGEGKQTFRTMMQCKGRQESGDLFLANVWFSTYQTSTGPRLAAMIIDASEDLRTREETTFDQLAATSRILLGAVSHEVRNICGAISIVHANLARVDIAARDKHLEALANLVSALERVATANLWQAAHQAGNTDLNSLLEELRIVVEPSLAEKGVKVQWSISSGLPPVWAERQTLMQVFLNLVRNSEHAFANRSQRKLEIAALFEGEKVCILFTDNGGGVANPDRLFRLFQPGTERTGLGLYLSRTLLRSFGGDLCYRPEPGVSTFAVELAPAFSGARGASDGPAHSDLDHRRSHVISGESHAGARG